MKDRICNCGGTKFTFIGIQPCRHERFFLKLYNCLKCHTTVSKKVILVDPITGKTPDQPDWIDTRVENNLKINLTT